MIDRDKYLVLSKICKDMAASAQQLLNDIHTGTNESIHRMMLTEAEKTIDYQIQYEACIGIIVLRYNKRDMASVMKAAQALDINIAPGAQEILYTLDNNRNIQTEYRASDNGRTKTSLQRRIIKALHVTNKSKATYYPHSREEKNARLLNGDSDVSAPKKKRQKKDNNFCGCTNSGKCKTDRCACRVTNCLYSDKCHKNKTIKCFNCLK